MRIGLVLPGSLDSVSGGYLYDRMLVDHLRRRGDSVEVVALPWRGYAWNLLYNQSLALMRRLRRARFDLLLQDELAHPALFCLNHWLRRRVAYPLVSVVHHLRACEQRPSWINRLYAMLERRYLHSVDAFVFNSQTTRASVERLSTVSRPGLVAYPGGDRFSGAVSSRHIQARARRPGDLEMVFVGNVIPRKGLHVLLAALARLPAHGWRLSVVGSLAGAPAYAHAMRRRIDHLRLGQRVRLLGCLPDAELASLLAASHLMVVPSAYEGFGIVYLEGMAFGLPSVASAAGATAELITSGRNGVLVAPGDVRALAEQLETFVRQRERSLYMGLAAHRRFLEHPTWAETTHRVGAFVHTLAA